MSDGPFGSGGWGLIPWGGGNLFGPFSLQGVEPWSEDALLVGFTQPPYMDGIGTPNDALDPRHYQVVTDGGIGLDGLPVRPVFVAAVERVEGRADCVLLWMDRSFSPSPCRYRVVVTGLISSVGAIPIAAPVSMGFPGLLRTIEMTSTASELGKDFANPQHGAATLDPLPEAGSATLLGVFPPDDAGDYAIDHGETSFQKRMLRRMFFTPGKTACLPKNYGLGILGRIKRLSTAHGRESLSADARDQIALEPEVLESSATCVQDGTHPGLSWLKIRARLRSTGLWSGFNMPFKTH